MTRTVVALYDDFAAANDTVRELVDQGFRREDISLMASDATGEYSRNLKHDDAAVADTPKDGAAQGAGVGAGVGAVIGGLGGLLVGLGALTIPGIGPVLAAGPLAAALTGLAGAGVGAVAGGVTGGILGALVDMGVPHETAQYYAEGVRRGGTLLTARVPDDMTQQAVTIMNRHNPVDINQRATQWRDSGWTGFNPQADVYEGKTNQDYQRNADRAAGNIAAGSAAGMAASGLAQSADVTSGEVSYPRGEAPTDENERKLWPKDRYRTADEQTGTEQERDLYQGTHAEHSSMAQSADPTTGEAPYPRDEAPTDENERKLWPRDEYRAPDEQVGAEQERTLWQGDPDEAYPSENIAGHYPAFEDYDTDFRHHYQTTMSGTSTYTYDQYQPAYRYGYDLATDERYRSYDWDRLEPEARRYWDERNPGTWERFKDAIQHAWVEIKDAAR